MKSDDRWKKIGSTILIETIYWNSKYNVGKHNSDMQVPQLVGWRESDDTSINICKQRKEQFRSTLICRNKKTKQNNDVVTGRG